MDERVQASAGNGTPGHEPWFQVLEDDTDLTALVTNAKNFGCSALKLYADISGTNAQNLIAIARQQNFPVWSHGSLFTAGPWDIIDSHSFSHSDFLNFVTHDTIPNIQDFYSDNFDVTYDTAKLNDTDMLKYFDVMKENNNVLDATLSVYDQAGPSQQHIVEFSYAATKAAHLKDVKIGAGVDAANEAVDGSEHLLLKEI